MMTLSSRIAVALALLGGSATLLPVSAQPTVVEPDSMQFSTVLNASAQVVEYRGRRAVRLTASSGRTGPGADMLAIVDRSHFEDGTIEIDVAGAPLPGADPAMRGFIGIAFRTAEAGEWSEMFFLRPINGRAEDQLQRNHSVQYVSLPEYPWYRLRAESPGVYESYADLETGAWTTMRIEVRGTTARLYVNGAPQPSLIVNDLKRGAAGGRIALWAHPTTEAYFGRMAIAPR